MRYVQKEGEVVMQNALFPWYKVLYLQVLAYSKMMEDLDCSKNKEKTRYFLKSMQYNDVLISHPKKTFPGLPPPLIK